MTRSALVRPLVLASCPLAALVLLAVAGCTALPMTVVPSENHNSRINYLVLHFTSESFEDSLRLLTVRGESPVSVHYLVPEPGDTTYPRRSLSVYQLVPESRRAWHAGRSHWAGAQNLNDGSIGIEIVNRSACEERVPYLNPATPENQDCQYLPYPKAQIDLLIRLIHDVLERNPDIDPVDVLGHGDIAPARRVDPGPLFPWRQLYEEGIGAWYDDATVQQFRHAFAEALPPLEELQSALARYGYAIDATGHDDPQSRFAVRAFQLHFRSQAPTGVFDRETAAILYALNRKYRSRSRAGRRSNLQRVSDR